jgi:hypothetical protein
MSLHKNNRGRREDFVAASSRQKNAGSITAESLFAARTAKVYFSRAVALAFGIFALSLDSITIRCQK